MTESSTPEHQLPAPGFVPVSFWADPIVPTPPPGGSGEADAAVADADRDRSELAPDTDRGSAADYAFSGGRRSEPRQATARNGAGDGTTADRPALDADIEDDGAAGVDDPPAADDERDAETAGKTDAGSEDEADAEADADDEADEDTDDESDEQDEEDEAAAQRRRFAELVEERVRRARYAHHLTRPVFTPAESAMAILVERRASVWVPTMTFVATIVSAIAAVVLATRLRSDPTDPSGKQLIVVTVTVCLLAAAFATLLRAEVHYERLRPRGRVVRHDVADAYELVRDAPRRMVQNDVPLNILRRVAALLPAAEQLVDALAAYSADGGTRVRAHPAYERIIRMRAEVEALEVMLEELEKSAVADPVHGVDAPLPQPDQVADYDGLVDLAEALTSES